MQGKFQKNPTHINHNGKILKNETDIANAFADFFKTKVESLSNTPIEAIQVQKPKNPLTITKLELNKALKKLNNKKSTKKESTALRPILLGIFNDFVQNGIPSEIKNAKITALHKKGDKELSSNYRPISNLSNISKAFEKCILDKLDKEVSNVGNNQHRDSSPYTAINHGREIRKQNSNNTVFG